VNSESSSFTLIQQDDLKVCGGMEVSLHIFLTLTFDRRKFIDVRPLYSLYAAWGSIITAFGRLAKIIEK
jgi:hypothetical protein